MLISMLGSARHVGEGSCRCASAAAQAEGPQPPGDAGGNFLQDMLCHRSRDGPTTYRAVGDPPVAVSKRPIAERFAVKDRTIRRYRIR
jgi:hypothetical protein